MCEPATKKSKCTFKNHKRNYHSGKRQFLEAGQRGFLATCNFHEKDCVREALNVLNHYADELLCNLNQTHAVNLLSKISHAHTTCMGVTQLYGPATTANNPAGTNDDKQAQTNIKEGKGNDGEGDAGEGDGDVADDGDIADELQKEIDATKATTQNKSSNKLRFRQVDTGAPNCVFISTTLADPVELGTRIVTDVMQSGEKKTRFLLRLVPVEMVCHANVTDIMKAGNKIFDKYFLKGKTTFAIVFNKRYNNVVKRDEVIHELAGLVQTMNIDNRVDLKNPEKTILVEVIKGLCCLSVVEGYAKYKKYNLVELAASVKAADDVGKSNVDAEEANEPQKTEESKEENEDVPNEA